MSEMPDRIWAWVHQESACGKINTWIAAQKEAKKQKRKQTDAEEKALYLRLKKKFEKGTV